MGARGSAAKPANCGEDAGGCVVQDVGVYSDAVLVEFFEQWKLIRRGHLFKTVVMEGALGDSAIGGNGGMGGGCGVNGLWSGDRGWNGGEWSRC